MQARSSVQQASPRRDALWCALAMSMPAVQLVAVHGLPAEGGIVDIRRAVFVVTTAVVIVVALHFRRYAGAWLVAGGVTMNLLPTVAHGGLMPVSFEALRESGAYPHITEASIGRQLDSSKGIVLHREDIRFGPLADQHYVNISSSMPNMYSLGDLVLFAGLGLVVLQIAGGVFVVNERKEAQPSALS